MAPSPENDTAPKAPDKCAAPKEKNKDDKTLSDLNDGELKGLLDEALNYKNPKDREGKSKLFNNLLNAAEEDERNDRAYRAGGSELVRYYNSSAKRGSRHRKKPSSISENMMHGGSLDNLAKEELFETSKHRTKKSVSARQREGGSLPCNVNASTIANHEYQFLEEARRKKEMTEKSSNNDLEAQSLLEHDSLDENYQEQIEITHYQPPRNYTTRASLQVSEVDSAIQFPNMDQTVERKICPSNKSTAAQLMATECASALRITSDGKVSLPRRNDKLELIPLSDRQKVDENGNALHQNLTTTTTTTTSSTSSTKTKKKKLLTDKNVVVCNAENVEGHRSDIIDNMAKLLEFIGISDEQSDKNGRTIKSSKQLNRHSSDESKSKKRAHSSKQQSKDGGGGGAANRSKLKKSNSLGEISTTNLEDFDFDKDKVVMRNSKSGTEKPRERRSWGNMEPLPLQNLYGNASAENLESAEFRVVTKKKKSKKRRSSVGGRTKTSSSTPVGKNDARGTSPDLRRKSACSVPHSEKSNDSSDVDSVHSLPIDTQRLNMPISYADMAKTNDKPKEKKAVPKEVLLTTEVKCATNQTVVVAVISCDKTINASGDGASVVVKNTPPDVHNIKNFPAIANKQVAVQAADKTKSSNKLNRNQNVQKNVKNNVNVNKTVVCVVEHRNNVQNEFVVSDGEVHYSSSLPPDIPDVQTIEKMQMIGQGHPPSNLYEPTSPHLLNNGTHCGSSVDCDISERTSAVERPPVVILSGFGNSKEVPGLVFGFDINEQLLSEDNRDFCCEDFIARYVAPENYTGTSHNHDKIVNFIGAAWEEAVVNLSNGKVEYYTDLL